nr:MAG TPA: hypothetical protein [Caudoviricetes sp.]
MNFYVDSGGVVLHVEPERIFQGSASSNTIRFIGAFASNLPVLVAFKLPNGVWTTPQSMGFSAQLSGVETKDGVQFNTWEYQIPQVVTENYGTVNVQFYVYGDAGGTGGQIATAMSSFVVEKGVPITLPDPTDAYETLLRQILAVLSQIQGEIGDLPNNYVTVDTNQTISGNKTHTGINTFNGFTSINGVGIDADAIVKGSDRFKYPVKSGTLSLTSDIPENIVTRDENEQIKVPLAPAQDDDAVSKKYVDDADNTKLNKVNPAINGSYAYTVSKSDIFGTTNGYTEISETDKIKTIAKRKTNGCIETRTPSADIEAANKGYVDTAISDTQGQLAQTNQNVEDLYTILEQAQVVTVTTLEQAYTTRETADGENVVDGVQTTVKEIRGKTVATENLIPYPYTETTKTANGVTFTVNSDGSITVNGTATSDADFMLLRGPIQGYSESYFLSGCPSGGSDTTYYISENFTASKDTGNGVVLNNLPSDQVWRIVIKSGTTVNNLVFRPMLNEGTEAKPYSKWFAGLKNVFFKEIVSTGKNLIPYPYAKGTDTLNGVTFTVNNDGTITADGTAIENAIFVFHNFDFSLSAGTYTVSGLENGGAKTYCLQISRDNYAENWNLYNGNIQINLENTSSMLLQFVIYKGTTVNNVVLKPMLNYGSSALSYEPYTSDTLSVKTPIELAEYDVAYPETGETKRNSGKKVFDGTETWEARGSAGDLYRYGAVLANVKTSGACVANLSGENSGASVAGNYFIDTEFKVFTNIATVDEWKAHLAEIATAGNPLTVIYETAEATTEATPFDKSKYIAWKNGSETIEQGANDNSEYGAENTVKQDYFTLTGGTTNV